MAGVKGKSGSPHRCKRCNGFGPKGAQYCGPCADKLGLTNDTRKVAREQFKPSFGGYFGREKFLDDKFSIVSEKFGIER